MPRLFHVGFILTILFFVRCNSSKQQENGTINNTSKKDSRCKKEKTDSLYSDKHEISLTSEITCPKCEFKKTETLPTDVCLLSYTCKKCQAVMHPKNGDCCIFCTYGSSKCPSKQAE